MEGNLVDRQTINLGQLVSMVNGELFGPADLCISGATPLYEVQAGQITLLDDLRQAESLIGCAAAIVVKQHIPDCSLPQIAVTDPRSSFGQIVQFFLDVELSNRSLEMASVGTATQSDSGRNISAGAHIDASAVIAADAMIEHGVAIGRRVSIASGAHLMPGVVVMDDTVLGENCTVFPNVTFYPRTRVGDNVTIHAGVVLGAYGFGYKSSSSGHQRTQQLGYVIIEDEVEIGACVTIDRGTFGSTRIGRGTKIDNQVMIGHNCQIGKYNLLCSQVGIAGSCKTGDFVVLAGQVGIKDHITLGDHAVVGAQAGVMDDLAGNQVYLGSPATPQREQMQIMAVQRRLPEIRRTVKHLEKYLPPRAGERAA